MLRSPCTPPRPYHHGNLRQALIEATLTLAEETGIEQVSLREVAKRVGVSSGAPFRHFADKRALMTAIAEEATRQLRLMVERDQHACSGTAADRLKALGHSFLAWATGHPTQFRLVSNRALFDFTASPSLAGHFAVVRELTVQLVEQAQREGALPISQPAAELALALRGSAYGLARMAVDGQLPQWHVAPSDQAATLRRSLDLIVDAMTRATPSTPRP
ncbi:TetR/AcrR family transcriptional regulator [uncultured Aquabacterium sp.]|jgi:AcrR family transcriptional regulator|uniref:TetR/AcrR family transcriptional regulator n=1 Tax=uncultured Aquabacterium sp. TaxID=158753 RepID=UPI00262B1DB3|nr:TetR/AcrR family transcriptional regulator [uncultured Aquabacterium sp.]